MIIPNNIIKSMFKNVYFITGTACAGKSTAVKLLAERFDGICCGENYHDIFMEHIDREHQPNLSYFETMKDWQEFVNRTLKQYVDWINGCSKEAESLEIIRLFQLLPQQKPHHLLGFSPGNFCRPTPLPPRSARHLPQRGRLCRRGRRLPLRGSCQRS